MKPRAAEPAEPQAANPDDVARARAAIDELEPPQTATPDEVDQALGAERPAAELHDRRTEPAPGDELDELDELDALANADPTELEAKLHGMTVDDLADVIELGFGYWADGHGAHWEIARKRSLRLAHWLKKVIARHAGALEGLLKNLPEIMCGVLFGYEIWSRVRIGRKLTPAESPPAPPVTDRPADGAPA